MEDRAVVLRPPPEQKVTGWYGLSLNYNVTVVKKNGTSYPFPSCAQQILLSINVSKTSMFLSWKMSRFPLSVSWFGWGVTAQSCAALWCEELITGPFGALWGWPRLPKGVVPSSCGPCCSAARAAGQGGTFGVAGVFPGHPCVWWSPFSWRRLNVNPPFCFACAHGFFFTC